MQKSKIAVRLTESAMMIALATILSLFKLIDLPYGGSITLASMFPILIIAYRYGTPWGLLCGLVHGAIQLLLGSHTLSYATSPAAAAAIIILDYLLAFAVIGLAGLLRKPIKKQASSLAAGAVLVCILRYACHVVSGATVWAGLSIPTADALVYSFIYNATYMLPEMLVLMIAVYYIGSALDFSSEKIRPLEKENTKSRVPSLIIGALLSAAGIFDVASIFAVLQNAESGEFDITGISGANWGLIGAVTLAAIILSVIIKLVSGSRTEKNS